MAPDFYFSWVGVDQKDEKEIISLRQQEVGSYKTLDEIREDAGLKPLGKDRGGDLVLNSTYTMALQQQKMAEMQQQQMDMQQAQGDQQGGGDQGDPGASGDTQGQEGDQEGENGQGDQEEAQNSAQDAQEQGPPANDEELRRQRPDLGDFYDQGRGGQEEESASKGKKLKKSMGDDRRVFSGGDRKYLSILWDEEDLED